MLNIFDQSAEAQHPTLFGFKTKNKLASQLLNYVYGVVMLVATAFAYHALSLILPDWNKLFVFLASISVVGLPYCIKIVLYGNDRFEPKHALLCLAISLLPAIFDFVGFYSETSIRQALVTTKFELVEKVNYFNTIARSKIEEEKIQILKEKDKKISDLNSTINNKISNLDSGLLEVKQIAIDEREGVKGSGTTGKVGDGPRAKELEAEIRKVKAKNDLEMRRLNEDKDLEIEKINNYFQAQLEKANDGLKEIDNLVSSDTKVKGILYQINNVDNFNDLAKVTIQVNNSISTISSKMNIEPQFVSFKTDDVIQLSFGALMRGETTALICWLLAFLLEMVDTIIVYMVRGVKRKEEKPKEDLKEKLFYKTYNTEIKQEKDENEIAKIFYPYTKY